MCGRYDNLIAREAYRSMFKAFRQPASNYPPRYNVAPTDGPVWHQFDILDRLDQSEDQVLSLNCRRQGWGPPGAPYGQAAMLGF